MERVRHRRAAWIRSVVLLVAGAGLWAWSLVWAVSWINPAGNRVTLGYGTFGIEWEDPQLMLSPIPPTAQWRIYGPGLGPNVGVRYWRPHWARVSGYWGGWLPLWMPLVPLAAHAGVARRRLVWERKGARGRVCTTCGYSRAGLRDGAACPECGSGAAPRSGLA